MRILLAMLAGFLVLLGLSFCTADAQQLCFSADDFETLLKDRFEQFPIWMSPMEGGAMFLVSRADGASWTLYFRRADGLACPVADGKGGQSIDAPEEKQESF